MQKIKYYIIAMKLKFTKTSVSLIKSILETECLNKSCSITQKTNNILKSLYNEVNHANHYIRKKRVIEGIEFYNLIIREIISKSEIPKPKLFNENSFPSGIIKRIDDYINYDLFYSFSLFNREINIHLLLEDEILKDINVYNSYIYRILVLICFLNKYSGKKCSKKLGIYIYLTDLKKELPNRSFDIIDSVNANTGFTYTCSPENEIVIYRKEEWFKVLAHEMMHSFGIDFSNMNVDSCNEKIKRIFKVNSNVNMYEAYTEFWGQMINCIFCSYYLENGMIEYDNFLNNFELFINIERFHGFLQLVKILKFMNLRYEELYLNDYELDEKRKVCYREKTNILSYYIIKQVLMNNYQGFLNWCSVHNLSLINFNKTYKNLDEFYKFIEKNYKSASMLEGINCFEDKKIKKNMLKNLRMTICEIE